MEKRFDYVVEAAKQITTLSSAGIVITLTFKEKFLSGRVLPVEFYVFFLLSIISILLALFCILTVAGSMERAMQVGAEPKIYTKTIRALFGSLVLSYSAALSFLFLGALKTI